MSNVYKGENRIEHHPLFAVAFLFEKEWLKSPENINPIKVTLIQIFASANDFVRSYRPTYVVLPL